MIEIQDDSGQGAILNFKRTLYPMVCQCGSGSKWIQHKPTGIHRGAHQLPPTSLRLTSRLAFVYDDREYRGLIRDLPVPGCVTVASLEATSGGTYKWPTKEDVLEYPVEDILRILDDPVPVGCGSRIQLRFWLVDIRRVTPLRMACHATEINYYV